MRNELSLSVQELGQRLDERARALHDAFEERVRVLQADAPARQIERCAAVHGAPAGFKSFDSSEEPAEIDIPSRALSSSKSQTAPLGRFVQTTFGGASGASARRLGRLGPRSASSL